MNDKSGEPCIICLCEEKTHQMRGIDCNCKYYIHQTCHLEYTNNKQKIECPICHTTSINNPFLTGREIYVKRNQIIEHENTEGVDSCQKGCMLGCCCYFVVIGFLGAMFG